MSNVSLSSFLPNSGIWPPEDKVYQYLENTMLKEGIEFDNIIPQYDIPGDGIIDYRCNDKKGTPVFIEVKRGFPEINDIIQTIKYWIHLKEKPHLYYPHSKFHLILFCPNISPIRQELLKKIGIEIRLYDKEKALNHD